MNNFMLFLSKNKPTLMTIGTCLGVVATAVISFKAGIKAERIMRENPDASKKDFLKEIAVPCILPMAAAVTGTSALAIGTNCVHLNREKEMAIIIQRTESKLNAVNQAVSSAAGAAAADALKKPKKEKGGDNIYRFLESYSGEWFEATLNEVVEAEYHLNRNFILRGYVSMDEVYAFFNMPNLETYDMKWIGWSYERGSDNGYQVIDFVNREKTDENGETYYIVEYPFAPEYLFSDEHGSD